MFPGHLNHNDSVFLSLIPLRDTFTYISVFYLVFACAVISDRVPASPSFLCNFPSAPAHFQRLPMIDFKITDARRILFPLSLLPSRIRYSFLFHTLDWMLFLFRLSPLLACDFYFYVMRKVFSGVYSLVGN